ncbi:YcdB/YcdC domain-containing protein [Paenibacillus herberti]|uniref:YcdB/YcdC repeated domain-containing protein n=1 Tax=Paenibacillus herberti TaxID=1619309 RepID=A0A229P295_9BACL|nr:YcdB/YcdC domain-containing protein [Paenibacillus herberti]OXM16228.1 hypothetical protein CGZ75_05930 [Paenibacillus herberti]
MPIDLTELKNIAKTIVEIPEYYKLEMEASIPQGNERERSYIWGDPNNEENEIDITLDLATGQLTRLAISREETGEAEEEPGTMLDEATRVAAHKFVAKYAPDPAQYTSVCSKKRGNIIEYTFRQEVGGLPLPDTGCKLMLDSKLNVIRYLLNGRRSGNAKQPQWPATIVDSDKVKQDIVSHMKMQLTIVTLYPSLYEMNGTDDEYRLVYEPVLQRQFVDAVTGRDLFGPEHYVMPQSYPIHPIQPARKPAVDETMPWEQQLGINLERYVLKKCNDDGQTIKSWYHLIEQEEEEIPEPDPLSSDAYMKRKWGDNPLTSEGTSILVELEKSTERLIGFQRLGRGEEVAPILNRKQCWEKAQCFLRTVFPEYAQYLQVERDKEESDGQKNEFFFLPVYIDGISVQLGRITITVSKSTGEICMYNAVSFEMIQEMEKHKFSSIIEPEAALKTYITQMKVQLKWHLSSSSDSDSNSGSEEEVPVFRLLYEPTVGVCNDEGKKRTLKYIDAISGEMIWGK